MIPTIRANIRAILKSEVITTDVQYGGTFLGSTLNPNYYRLDMVVALAFRIQSPQAKILREWVFRKCTTNERQSIVLQTIVIQVAQENEINH